MEVHLTIGVPPKGRSPYDPGLLSVSRDVSGCPFLRDVLSESDCRYLEEKSELMLGSEAEDCVRVEPFWDPKWLHDIHYFLYTTEPECKVGVFFVRKSSRTVRLITDAPVANQRFRAAPGVNLMSSESFCCFEVTFDGSVFADPEEVAKLVVHVDWSDAKFSCDWPATLHGSQCPPLAEARLLYDRGRPLTLQVSREGRGEGHYYVYVDNFGVIDLDSSRADHAMSLLSAAFIGLGFELHASEVSGGSVEALGCLIEGNKLRSRITHARLWKVHQSVEGLLRRGRCSGRALGAILGHLTFCGLMSRMSLSILHTVYAFIRKYEHSVSILWPSLIAELTAFTGILFILAQDWWRPWNRLVTSSDSSLAGFGVCQAWWPQDKVAECGLRLERSRLRVGSPFCRRVCATICGVRSGCAWPLDQHQASRGSDTVQLGSR